MSATNLRVVSNNKLLDLNRSIDCESDTYFATPIEKQLLAKLSENYKDTQQIKKSVAQLLDRYEKFVIEDECLTSVSIHESLHGTPDRPSFEIKTNSVEIDHPNSFFADEPFYHKEWFRPFVLLLFSVASGALTTLFFLSTLLNTGIPPLFWLVMLLPCIGVSAGVLLIMCGVNKERYV